MACAAALLPLAAAELWMRRARTSEPERAGTSYALSGETASGRPLTEGPRGSGGARAGIVMRHEPYLVFFPKPSQALPGITINAQGFRGRDWELERRPGTVRVLLLGGSTAFGQGASDDRASLRAALERALSDHAPGFEVLNGAVIGYDSTQELVLLATRLLAYRPDVVLVLDGWNDFHLAGKLPPGCRVLANPWFHDVDERIARASRPWAELWRSSALLRRVESKLNWRAHQPPESDFGRYTDRLDVALPRYGRNLACLVRLARAHGARVVLAAQPELFQRCGPIPERERRLREERGRDGYAELARAQYARWVETARAVASEEGAAFVDGTKVFDGHDEPAFVDAVHLDDRGQALLAEVLAAEVARAWASGPAAEPPAAGPLPGPRAER